MYGRPSGIVGLRVYPNPKFDDAARKRWDPQRYYADPNLLQRSESGAALRGRHGVRILPRVVQSGEAAGRSRKAVVGEPVVHDRKPVLQRQPHLWEWRCRR